jgi:hypothetical protein
MPVAETNLLRLIWLARHARRSVAGAVDAIEQAEGFEDPCDYLLRFVEGEGWREDIEAARAEFNAKATERMAAAVEEAIRSSTVTLYETPPPSPEPARGETYEQFLI